MKSSLPTPESTPEVKEQSLHGAEVVQSATKSTIQNIAPTQNVYGKDGYEEGSQNTVATTEEKSTQDFAENAVDVPNGYQVSMCKENTIFFFTERRVVKEFYNITVAVI